MLFYFVFHFLKNCNDVHVMYCLPVGCNNKKYKLQRVRLADPFDRPEPGRSVVGNNARVDHRDAFEHSNAGRRLNSSKFTIRPSESRVEYYSERV